MEDLNVFKEALPSGGSGLMVFQEKEFLLQGGEEGFDRRVVSASVGIQELGECSRSSSGRRVFRIATQPAAMQCGIMAVQIVSGEGATFVVHVPGATSASAPDTAEPVIVGGETTFS